MSGIHPYLDVIGRRATPSAFSWLLEQWRAAVRTTDAGSPESVRAHADYERQLGVAYAASGRRFGGDLVALTDAESDALRTAGLLEPEGWPLRDVARAALLLRACAVLPPAMHPPLLRGLYTRGDNAEREALLRTLSVLPGAERFAELATEACRSHVQSVFEALACDNPYPARFLPPESFNQLVLKAFFTGVAVARIQGLDARRSAELARMAEAYASERQAAGRAVPADLGFVTLGFGRMAP
jgi:hypothetical protein